jgi:MoaA/NifB/PqqE/SkfB family radical SAM enzyme
MQTNSAQFREFKTPVGLLLYERDSGLNILLDSLKFPRFDKPLYVQVKVTNKCNLHCAFCSQRSDSSFAHEWSFEELFSLFQYLDQLKIEGIALGGGEPFTFPRLAELVKKTWNETGLDVSITSNGLLIRDDDLNTLRGNVGEIRVSCWTENDVSRAKRLVGKGVPIAINTILFSNGTKNVARTLRAAQNLGIDDFLILQCRQVGRAGPNMCPSEADFQELARLVKNLDIHVKVDVGTGVTLAKLGLHRLDLESTTNPILCITEDKCISPDSFSREKIPLRRFEDIPRLFEMWQEQGKLS